MLRAIAYIVRDRDWGTYEPAISDLVIDAGRRSAFAVSYSAVCTGPGGSSLEFRASITGTRDGALEFDVTAVPRR